MSLVCQLDASASTLVVERGGSCPRPHEDVHAGTRVAWTPLLQLLAVAAPFCSHMPDDVIAMSCDCDNVVTMPCANYKKMS